MDFPVDLEVCSFLWAAKVCLPIAGWEEAGVCLARYLFLSTIIPATQPCCQGAGANGLSLPHAAPQGTNNVMERETG